MPELDPQNPLPEPSFVWRRWITIALLIAMGVGVWWFGKRVPDADAKEVILWLLFFGFGALTYYATGASVGELSALFANLKLRIGGKGPEA